MDKETRNRLLAAILALLVLYACAVAAVARVLRHCAVAAARATPSSCAPSDQLHLGRPVRSSGCIPLRYPQRNAPRCRFGEC